MSEGRIISEIINERNRQRLLWGTPEHSLPEFMSILTEEVGEACSEANSAHWGDKDRLEALRDLRTELIQVAAVAVQIIENVDKEIRRRIEVVNIYASAGDNNAHN